MLTTPPGNPEANGFVSQYERKKLSDFLRVAIKTPTGKKHDLNWARWLKFLGGRGEEEDPYLTGRQPAEQGQALGLFVMWLLDEEGLSAETAIRCLSSVSNGWKEDAHEISLFTEPYLATVRKAARRTGGTAREQNRARIAKQRMPVVLEMVEWLRTKYICGELLERMTYLGVALAFHFMFRVSEYVFGADGEHCIMLEDVDFILEDDTRVRPWELASCKKEVKLALVMLRSRKNDQAGRGQCLYLSRRTPLEARLLDDLVSFCSESGGQVGDPLLCRYKSGRCLKLTTRHVKAALTVIAHHFNFEACVFAGHSMRIGGATTSRTAGATRDEVRRVGGWAEGSSVDEIYHRGTQHDVGTLGRIDLDAMSPVQILSVADVMNMMPPGWIPRVS